ncbi:hypothetical protein L1987_25366 [Smallanthus sonchifolius]|uniref:Uncharacterized protein n=1 Tax=Smallanthus sonchifolius TaxID=185202 RepID=A0ACB9IM97_9ASTR|nr:hypothetical protein L1987_25366 [Smallanthus sonchifolius]
MLVFYSSLPSFTHLLQLLYYTASPPSALKPLSSNPFLLIDDVYGRYKCLYQILSEGRWVVSSSVSESKMIIALRLIVSFNVSLQ